MYFTCRVKNKRFFIFYKIWYCVILRVLLTMPVTAATAERSIF